MKHSPGQVQVPVTPLERMASLSLDELSRDLSGEEGAYLNSGNSEQGIYSSQLHQQLHHQAQPTSESFTFADIYPPESGENENENGYSAGPVELPPHSHSVAPSRSPHALPAHRPPTVVLKSSQTMSGSNPLARRPRK